MSKKDIGKLLTTGSAKQRMLLISEDVARSKFNKERLLTDHEFRTLSDSFKKPNEIKLWNKFKRADDIITNALINLQGLTFEVKMHYSDLRGYILVWNSIETTELLVNSVLHEIKDPKERKRIAQNGARGINLLFSKTTPDEEGYIDIQIDFEKESYKDENGRILDLKEKPRKSREGTLWYVMNNVKAQAEEAAIRFISWRAAILDYMEETGFNVKTYKDLIEKFTTDIYTPVIGWKKYQSNTESFLSDARSERLDKIKDKYAITPHIEELKVDTKVYNWFKQSFLSDE